MQECLHDVKRYEISYANQVLATLVESARGSGTSDDDGAPVAEVSVRGLAADAGLSASATQIGLTTLRRADKIKTDRKGSAGRPSLISITDGDPLAEIENVPQGRSATTPTGSTDGAPLADALMRRYEELLLEVEDSRSAARETAELRARIRELEAENVSLRRRLKDGNPRG